VHYEATVPTVKDRVVQTALVLLLQPIFEADFNENSFGYRPGRSAHQAVDAIKKALLQGKHEVIDADLSAYFDTIPHAGLLRLVAGRVSDGAILGLIKRFLRAPIVEEKDGKRTVKPNRSGVPQGGSLSPLLANLYLNGLDHGVNNQRSLGATLVRYADDSAPRAKDDMMQMVLCVTAQLMRESKTPRDRLTGAGLKSPLAAVVKSHGRERRRKRPGIRPGQMSDREMNASEPLTTCRKRRDEVKTGGKLLTRDQHGRSLFRTVWPPARRWHDPVVWQLCGTWEPSAPMPTERSKQMTCEDRSREAARRDGSARSSDEVPDKGMERRGRAHEGWTVTSTGNGRN